MDYLCKVQSQKLGYICAAMELRLHAEELENEFKVLPCAVLCIMIRMAERVEISN